MPTDGPTEVTAPRRSDPTNDPVGMLRERLLDRDEQLQTAQEMAEFGIWEWDIPAQTVEWSSQLHVIYGTTPETYDGYLERVHPDDREHVEAAIQGAYRDHVPFEFDERIVRPDGSVRTLHSRGRVVVDLEDNLIRMIGVCQDVTAQRAAHEAVRETAQRLAEAQSIAHLGSWIWDIEADRVSWSDEMYQIYGLSPDTFPASYAGFLEHVHPDDREEVAEAVQAAFASGGEFEFEHRIIRGDGHVRILQAHGRTITDERGRPIRMVGTGHDVTEQHEAQTHAAQAEVAIELAHRLANLQRITEVALTHLSLDELLPELLDRVRETLAVDTAAALLMDDDRETLVLSAARGAGENEVGFRIAVGGGFAGRVAAERKMIVVGEGAHEFLTTPELKASKIEAMIGVPLMLREDVVGVLHIGSFEPRAFTADEIVLLELAADRAALAIEHAKVFERERGIAETLQRALLPTKLPELGEMSAAVRYVPAADGVEIGGDWYDVIPLDDGRVGVALGDVTGHGLEAAALMALLRHGLRAYALEGLAPDVVAERLDRLIHTPDLERLATLVYAVIEPDLSVEYVIAGHLPPLVVRPGRGARFLDAPGGLPIGCQTGPGYHIKHVQLDPGDLLIMYTDGLIERRGESIDVGLERLRDASLSGSVEPPEMADHLLRTLLPGASGDDDIALLAIRPRPVPPARAL